MSRIKQETINRMCESLKVVHRDIRSSGFNIFNYFKGRGFSSYSVDALIELNLINRVSRGNYFTNFNTDQIHPILAREIISKSYEIKKVKNYKIESKPKSESQVEKVNGLSSFTDSELLSELKLRGYSGNLNKQVKF